MAAFNAAGQYDVTVQVTDSAGAGGGAEIPITVGSRPPTATGDHRRTGGGTNRKSHSPTGPRKSSGQHAGAGAGTHTSSSTTGGKSETTPSGYHVDEPDLDHGESSGNAGINPQTRDDNPLPRLPIRLASAPPPIDQAADSRLPLAGRSSPGR